MAENFLLVVGRAMIPKRLRPDLRVHLMKAGYSEVPYNLFGLLFFIAAAISYILFMGFTYPWVREKATSEGVTATLQFGFISFVSFTVIISAMLFLFAVITYFYWNIKIYHRTKDLEVILPDYLTLVSTNLKGGMSFENSLWNAIKPEFGILANEIALVSKRVMTGNDVQDALTEFAMKYESPTLRRTIQLLIGEIEAGGQIVDTIDRVISDMKKTQALKREMAASTITYMIFIGMLVIFICPVLFALSLQLFTITSGFIASMGESLTSGPGGMSFTSGGVDIDDFKVFSILAIGIIGTFSSLIIAIIEKGEIKAGIKYIPMFLVSSLTIYLIAAALFNTVFGGIQFGG
ncbi:hypothetical protein GOV11_02050 [Candidatus Woesearchaeota archaeon]|nr:hypothetical protein [Candidatus Woesearchaeota archaeon]